MTRPWRCSAAKSICTRRLCSAPGTPGRHRSTRPGRAQRAAARRSPTGHTVTRGRRRLRRACRQASNRAEWCSQQLLCRCRSFTRSRRRHFCRTASAGRASAIRYSLPLRSPPAAPAWLASGLAYTRLFSPSSNRLSRRYNHCLRTFPGAEPGPSRSEWQHHGGQHSPTQVLTSRVMARHC